MKLLSIFLSAAFVGVINGQTDCDFNYVCDDTGSPGDLDLAAPSALACYQACKASVDTNGDPDCLFWTYYEELGYGRSFDEENDPELDNVDGKLRASGKPVCRKLTSCDTTFDKSACGYTVGGAKCASGPGSCEDCDKCDPLSYGAGSAVAHWTCDVDLPYRKNAFAPGTKCRTECPSTQWSADFAEATCVSGCAGGDAKGTWTLTTTVQDGRPADVTPTTDSECLCENIVLGDHQKPTPPNGATSEAGARFYCDEPLKDDGNGNLNTMDSTSKCQLSCNGHIAMDIKCIAGSWTAGVQTSEDIYCWGPPLECDYNPGVNSDVCTCTDGGGTTNICAAGDGCDAGTCLTACQPGPDPIPDTDGCFCKTPTGGATCPQGNTCDADGVCTIP